MKRKTHIIKILAGLLMPLNILICAVFPLIAFASENVPVTIDIPLTYIVRGNDKEAGGDCVTLTPDDPAAPMPADSSGGKKTIKISGEGSYSFGQIYYDRPEVWWYTITREVTQKKGVTKDDTVYKAKVIALNDGHGYVLVFREGSDEKQELIYEDRVAPDTGDTSDIASYAVIMAAAACALIIFAVIRIKTKKSL